MAKKKPYVITLFKNKSQINVIKKTETLKEARKLFNHLRKENDKVVFHKKVMNARPVRYEIGIIGPSNRSGDVYTKDRMGRNIKLESSDGSFSVLEVSPYKMEEYIHDKQKNKRITMEDFVDEYIRADGIKLLSKLNHKLLLQNDDAVFLFALKSQAEAERFVTVLRDYLTEHKLHDTITVKDLNRKHRRWLYALFREKNLPIEMLYRKYTTYKPRASK